MSDQVPDRNAIADEVWNDAEQSPETITEAEPTQELIVEPEVEPVAPDPWAGIPPALREEVEGLRAKLGSLDEMSYRLKQTESRLGGVLNDLHAAKEAAKTVVKAPTVEQMEQAASNKAAWDTLNEDFPEWNKATEHRLAAERAEIMSRIPDVESIRKEMQAASGEELERMKLDFGKTIVSFKHPKWTETIATEEFMKWQAETGAKDSFDPLEVIATMDAFYDHQSKQKSSGAIIAERKKRLEESQTTSGHRLPPAKSETDMSPSELRASIAKEVFG